MECDTCLVYPYVLSIFGIKCPLLERPQLQCKLGTNFLQPNLLGILEYIPIIACVHVCVWWCVHVVCVCCV